MCSVRQANNVLLWTNFVRQKDSVLMLSVRFDTLNFVQFSWDAVFFFTVAYLQILTILITRIVIIIFENLDDVLSIFFVLWCIPFLFCCFGLFIVNLHLTHSSTLCTKFRG